ncbi:amidohydrolase family protein [Jiangella mangrovi]|uniref:Putative TIM-barrel fold metal-dependent hydrolase n=1 Tax=Jiangella mangrovi TaxID=1524084 RepID=A0A7W9GUT9_9ACTN|nr:amidohydrolase family protein [Jiangella mangrovi]MBB5790111.1 putative TIM-barrel fold metal-dependent hydrolase [Jiangella mangrovi]
MIIDSHTHVWPRWPYEPRVPDDTGRGSYQNLLFQMDQHGVDQALLVNARIERADDNNDYGAEAVRAHPDRFHHIVDVDSRWGADYHRSGAADRLRKLVDTYQPAGVSHYLRPENDGWLLSDEGRAFFAVAAAHRLTVSLAAPPVWLDDLRDVARRFPEVPLLVNHLAVVMLHPGGIEDGLRLALDSEDLPNLLVKVSGYYYGSDRPWDYPYTERLRIVRAFHETWGPRRMVWASDHPSLLAHVSYRQSLEVLREHAGFLPADDLALILGGNLAALLAERSVRP